VVNERGGRLALLRAAVVVCALAACAPPTAPVASRPPGSPDATDGLAPAPTSIATLDVGAIEFHLIDARHVPADTTLSAAGQVLWTAGDTTPSEIWRYVPGAPAPERVFASARSTSIITALAASSRGYAFVEQSKPDFGDGGWRVWYLSGPGADAVEIARGLARLAGSAPTVAIDDRRIAWAAFDEPVGTETEGVLDHAVTRLATAPVANLSDVTTVLELPVRKRLLWYPALHGDELWYSVIDPGSDPDADGPEYHVEWVDLARPADPPARLRSSDHDFDAVASADFVAWKANPRGAAALNWGTLHVLDRATQAQLAVPGVSGARPSLGARFMAFREITNLRLEVFDLAASRLVDLTDAASLAANLGGQVTYAGQSISGRLLAFSVGRADPFGPPRIGWAVLPE
jgi:hypothetical protein